MIYHLNFSSNVHEIDETEVNSQQMTFRLSTSYDLIDPAKAESSSVEMALSNYLKSAPSEFCLDASNINIESHKSDSVISHWPLDRNVSA